MFLSKVSNRAAIIPSSLIQPQHTGDKTIWGHKQYLWDQGGGAAVSEILRNAPPKTMDSAVAHLRDQGGGAAVSEILRNAPPKTMDMESTMRVESRMGSPRLS